jgi:RNA polymerase primary sigma factor
MPPAEEVEKIMASARGFVGEETEGQVGMPERAAPDAETREAEGLELISTYYRHMRKRKLLSPQEEETLGGELQRARDRVGAGLSALVDLMSGSGRTSARSVRPLTAPSVPKGRRTRRRFENLPTVETLIALAKRHDPAEIRPILQALDEHPRRETLKIREDLRGGLAQMDAIKETLVLSNLRLVASTAKRYLGSGLPLLDLVQEGNIGLMRAAEKFDPEKGCRFSTYATWWIQQKIRRAIDEQGRTVRLPVYRIMLQRRVQRIKHDLTQELGRRPDFAEVARRGGITEDQLDSLNATAQEALALQDPLGEDGEIGDLLPDAGAPSPEEQAERREFREQVLGLLEILTPRDRELMRMRYGIGYAQEHTLEEVGERFGITRERVRQVEAHALRKLKGIAPQRMKALLSC